MKLRIRGNSLRFRLGRSEVETFGRTGTIRDRVRFGREGNDFGYSIEKTSENIFSACFSEGAIEVRIPASDADSWVDSGEVSLAGTFLADDQTELRS